jgi:hypothetical protein
MKFEGSQVWVATDIPTPGSALLYAVLSYFFSPQASFSILHHTSLELALLGKKPLITFLNIRLYTTI